MFIEKTESYRSLHQARALRIRWRRADIVSQAKRPVRSDPVNPTRSLAPELHPPKAPRGTKGLDFNPPTIFLHSIQQGGSSWTDVSFYYTSIAWCYRPLIIAPCFHKGII